MEFMNADYRISSGDDVDTPVKDFRHVGTQQEEDCLGVDWRNLCIRCVKGGKVLVCCETGCPVVVHDQCLGCSARFDEVGNFYCPYCVYKRSVQELNETKQAALLAEKALSTFLGEKGVDAVPWEKTTEALNMENRCDSLDQSVQLEENRQEEMLVPECTTCSLKHNEANVSLENKQSDVSHNGIGEKGRLNDNDDHIAVVEKEIYSEPVVVSGRNGDCCREEAMLDKFEVTKVSKMRESGDKGQIDKNQTKRVVEDQQEADTLSASSVEDQKISDDVDHVSTEKNLKNVEGQNHEEATETGKPFMSGEPDLRVDSEVGEEDKDTDSSCPTKTISKEKTRVHLPTVGSPRRSARKLSSGRNFSLGQNEKISTFNKSAKPAKSSKKPTNSPVPKGKRKRLAWRAEEEEMLREGVHKFLKTVKKNLPWQKILESGCDVFDKTRTPTDLKDKWKNILAKEPLSAIS